jgi:hypothetical protein
MQVHESSLQPTQRVDNKPQTPEAATPGQRAKEFFGHIDQPLTEEQVFASWLARRGGSDSEEGRRTAQVKEELWETIDDTNAAAPKVPRGAATHDPNVMEQRARTQERLRRNIAQANNSAPENPQGVATYEPEKRGSEWILESAAALLDEIGAKKTPDNGQPKSVQSNKTVVEPAPAKYEGPQIYRAPKSSLVGQNHIGRQDQTIIPKRQEVSKPVAVPPQSAATTRVSRREISSKPHNPETIKEIASRIKKEIETGTVTNTPLVESVNIDVATGRSIIHRQSAEEVNRGYREYLEQEFYAMARNAQKATETTDGKASSVEEAINRTKQNYLKEFVTSAASSIRGTLKNIESNIGSGLRELGGGISGAYRSAENLLREVDRAIDQTMRDVAKAVADAARAIEQVTRQVYKAVKAAARAVEEFCSFVARTVERVAREIAKIIRGVYNQITNLISQIDRGFSWLTQKLPDNSNWSPDPKEALRTGGEIAGAAAGIPGAVVGDVFSTVGTETGPALEQIRRDWENLNKIPNLAWDGAKAIGRFPGSPLGKMTAASLGGAVTISFAGSAAINLAPVVGNTINVVGNTGQTIANVVTNPFILTLLGLGGTGAGGLLAWNLYKRSKEGELTPETVAEEINNALQGGGGEPLNFDEDGFNSLVKSNGFGGEDWGTVFSKANIGGFNSLDQFRDGFGGSSPEEQTQIFNKLINTLKLPNLDPAIRRDIGALIYLLSQTSYHIFNYNLGNSLISNILGEGYSVGGGDNSKKLFRFLARTLENLDFPKIDLTGGGDPSKRDLFGLIGLIAATPDLGRLKAALSRAFRGMGTLSTGEERLLRGLMENISRVIDGLGPNGGVWDESQQVVNPKVPREGGSGEGEDWFDDPKCNLERSDFHGFDGKIKINDNDNLEILVSDGGDGGPAWRDISTSTSLRTRVTKSIQSLANLTNRYFPGEPNVNFNFGDTSLSIPQSLFNLINSPEGFDLISTDIFTPIRSLLANLAAGSSATIKIPAYWISLLNGIYSRHGFSFYADGGVVGVQNNQRPSNGTAPSNTSSGRGQANSSESGGADNNSNNTGSGGSGGDGNGGRGQATSSPDDDDGPEGEIGPEDSRFMNAVSLSNLLSAAAQLLEDSQIKQNIGKMSEATRKGLEYLREDGRLDLDKILDEAQRGELMGMSGQNIGPIVKALKAGKLIGREYALSSLNKGLATSELEKALRAGYNNSFFFTALPTTDNSEFNRGITQEVLKQTLIYSGGGFATPLYHELNIPEEVYINNLPMIMDDIESYDDFVAEASKVLDQIPSEAEFYEARDRVNSRSEGSQGWIILMKRPSETDDVVIGVDWTGAHSNAMSLNFQSGGGVDLDSIAMIPLGGYERRIAQEMFGVDLADKSFAGADNNEYPDEFTIDRLDVANHEGSSTLNHSTYDGVEFVFSGIEMPTGTHNGKFTFEFHRHGEQCIPKCFTLDQGRDFVVTSVQEVRDGYRYMARYDDVDFTFYDMMSPEEGGLALGNHNESLTFRFDKESGRWEYEE